MAKSVWEGHLRLSLVTCPVALFSATDPRGGVRFHLINPKTRSRIIEVTKDPTTGEELDRRDLVRGFEVTKDHYVLVEPDELKALRVESTRELDIDCFVDAATIDHIYWDRPYYLAPADKTGVEAFAVIVEAMRRKKRVGIGRLVLNMRERICALEPREGRLLLTMLRTHEDIVKVSEIGGISKLPRPDRNMLEIAEKIVEQRKGKFDPSDFKDRYEDAVRDLIARKKKGRKMAAVPVARKEEANVTNLMDALRRSLKPRPRAAKKGVA